MIIRAYQLKVGDIFRKQGTDHRVIKEQDMKYLCRCMSSTITGFKQCGKNGAEIGIFSQERVELITKQDGN